MNPRLVAIGGPLKGKVFPLEDDHDFSVGREPSNRLPISDPSVSRRHCVIVKGEEHSVLRDLDSRNGTFVNDVPVRERVLQSGDQVKIGTSLFVFLLPEEEAAGGEDLATPEDEHLLTRTILQLKSEDAVYLQAGEELRPTPRVVKDLRALFEISLAISSIRELEPLERRLFELIFEVVPAERGAVLLLDESDPESASVFELARQPEAASTVAVSRTILQRVLNERHAILSNDVLESETFRESASLIASRSRSLIAAPLVLFEKTLGVIYLDTTDPRVAFDEGHLQLVTAIAGAAAVALDNALRIQQLENENRRLHEEINIEHNMVGESPRMKEVYEFVGKVAGKDTTVLIRGQSGTGKELVARAIHQNSPRADQPFVAINCAALAETLLESELFGHEKGAFTGAIAQKRGKLEVANGGTLFLDEVGEVPLSVQVKLLRVLQEREFERVGGTRPIKVDIRLITATNRDLEAAIKAGAFRQDLYFRLNVVSLTMPLLRERREDIPLLANYFIAKFGPRAGRKLTGISPEARSLLLRYDWPGNVRELENAIEHAVVLGSSDMIRPEDLPESVIEAGRPEDAVDSTNFHRVLLETKKKLILNAVEQAEGNLTEAARLLGLHPNYLHRLITNMDLRADLRKGAPGRN